MHPSLRIVALIALAMALQLAVARTLGLLGLLVILAAFALYPVKYGRMLTRSRWLLLTLLLIFSFSTPGEYVHGWALSLAPTYEGIFSGLLQVGRLAIMLAGLTLLLGSTQREALMSGIHVLLQPLRFLGISPARFTARLWLTLHYVELPAEKRHGSKWAVLEALAQDVPDEPARQLVLDLPGLCWVDGLVLGVAGASLICWLA